MPTLFISDLHLSKERPEINTLFHQFLETEARRARALYILGDLFEAWLGDDLVLPEYQASIQAMHSLTSQGVPLYVMHGNRDFLLSSGFAEMSGCTLLYEPSVIDLYGVKTLLLHGDILCTDDVEYLKFRKMVRDPQWQKSFLSQPAEARIATAEKYRSTSKTETATKAENIMDVNQDAVVNAMRDAGVTRLIHGHTHRPAVHNLSIDGTESQRLVLGDWFRQGSVLECSEQACQLRELAIT